MKDFATPHSNSNSDFPLYLHKLPGQDRPQLANPWDSLARASHRPIPEIPAELSVRISGRAPHELSRTTLYVADLLLCGDLPRLRCGRSQFIHSRERFLGDLNVAPRCAAPRRAALHQTTPHPR